VQLALPVGWWSFAVAGLWLGRNLRHPPTLAGAAVELTTAVVCGWIYLWAAHRRPTTALALPEFPGVALALAWIAAAAAGSDTPAPGGGDPLGGGAPSALLAVVAVLGVGLVATWIPVPTPGPFVGPREAIAGALAAVVGLCASAWSDPTWFPSSHTLATLAPGLVSVAVVTAITAVATVRPRSVFSFLMVIAPFLAVFRMPPRHPDPAERIVLVTVDTLRWDHAERMASVQRLAARGATFSDALAAGSWTVPSLGSAHTGLWPSAHGAGRPGGAWPGVAGLDPHVPTLAERLSEAGWATGAATTNVFLVPALGFDRGFDAFLHADARPDAALLVPWLFSRTAGLAPRLLHRDDGEEVVDTALAWLDGTHGPAFLWVHLLDPHLPYHHAELAPEQVLFPTFGPIPTELSTTAVRRGHLRDGPAERAAVRALYAAEVAWADKAVGRLLDGVDARGGATVVLTSDHGEEFWEHGGFEHGHALWPEITHVPFVVAGPGIRGPTVRTDPVSVVDVAPTVLGVAGLQARGLDGVDVFSRVPPDRLRRIQGTLYFVQQQAVVLGAYALVAADGAPMRLYYRQVDPGWTVNMADLRPEAVDVLAPLLDPRMSAGPAATVDAQALKALGYVE
jgi:arylsulfatase